MHRCRRPVDRPRLLRFEAYTILATIWLSGCATVGSDGSELGACPPVVEYSLEFQSRAAEQTDLLPEGSAIVVMLCDYNVMREQARPVDVCKWGMRRRERPMLQFRRVRSLQKFATVHASVSNHFNQERSLSSRDIFKANRAAALAEWRGLCAG
ncbi:MAG: hypothetical protein RLN72_03210 [Henriciella sp.]